MIKKILKILQGTIFFLCLAAPLGSLFLYSEKEPWGNIPLPKSISGDDKHDDSFSAKIKKFSSSLKYRKTFIDNALQHSFFKKTAFRLKHEAMYKVSAVDHKLIRSGRDGYIFFKKQFDRRTCESLPVVFMGLESTSFILDWAKLLGLDIKIIVPPNKASFEEDKLPIYSKETKECYKIIGEELRNASVSAFKEQIVFHYNTLKKIDSPSTPVFSKLDTHWTNFAGYLSILELKGKLPEKSEFNSLLKTKPWKTDLGSSMLMLGESILGQHPTKEALKRLDGEPLLNENGLILHDSFYGRMIGIVQKGFPKSKIIPYGTLDTAEVDLSKYNKFIFSIVERNFPLVFHIQLQHKKKFAKHLENLSTEKAKECNYNLKINSFKGENGVYAFDLEEQKNKYFKSLGQRAPIPPGILFKSDELDKYNCLDFEITVANSSKLEFHYLPTLSKKVFPQPLFRFKHLSKNLKKGKNKISLLVPRMSQLKLEVKGVPQFKLDDFRLGQTVH